MLGDVDYVYQRIDGMTQDERRALIRAVVERVTLHPRRPGTKRLEPQSVTVKIRTPGSAHALPAAD